MLPWSCFLVKYTTKARLHASMWSEVAHVAVECRRLTSGTAVASRRRVGPSFSGRLDRIGFGGTWIWEQVQLERKQT